MLDLPSTLPLDDCPDNGMRVVSLYSGAGGLDAGFIRAGFRPVWANDHDPVAVETYNTNIRGRHAVAGDIEKLRSRLPEPGSVDAVIGGPPCQGFSVAGHMRADDPRSRHVWTFLEIVEQLQPRGFVMENVAALATTRRWTHVIAKLIERAEQLKYNVRLAVLDASHYGVPQRRQRMFLVGVRGGCPQIPTPVTAAEPPTVRQTLQSLPPYGSPGNDSLCTAIVTPARNPVLRRSPYAGLLLNGKGRVLNLDAPALTLPASMGGNRTPVVDEVWLEGGDSWIEGYVRSLWHGDPSVTELPKRFRRLTVQEAAALQTFPAGWQFAGTQSAQFRQIGNAVPATLGFHVARAFADALGQREQATARRRSDRQLVMA